MLLQFQDFVSDGNSSQAMDFFMNPYSIDTGDKVPAKVDYSTAISKTLIKQL